MIGQTNSDKEVPMTDILRIVTLLVGVLSAMPVTADSIDDEESTFPDLRDSFDPSLQRGLERSVARLGLSEAVRQKKLAVAVVDISRIEVPRVAAVNGDEMMYAASLPKIAILLGAFVEIERGRMKLDGPTRDTLEQMIRVSSNEAATTMLRRVGKQNLERILTSDRYRLYDPAYNGGLWVGKEYGPNGAYHRDPLHNLSHGATATQVARFYYMLETGQLATPKLTRQMKETLGNPGIHHKFVKGLEDKPGSRIYRKSGTWEQWHADSAIVERDGHKYIIVGLAEDPHGGEWLVDLVKPVDDMIIPTRMAALDSPMRSLRRTAIDAPRLPRRAALLDREYRDRPEMRLVYACARDASHGRLAVLCR
ncbi:MAG: serine hydrolase [Chromatiales bacterium]